jgi:hypothetical protein
LFFAAVFFVLVGAVPLLFLPEPLGDSEDEGFRFARRFIQPAKGRLRDCRSSGPRISIDM